MIFTMLYISEAPGALLDRTQLIYNIQLHLAQGIIHVNFPGAKAPRSIYQISQASDHCSGGYVYEFYWVTFSRALEV